MQFFAGLIRRSAFDQLFPADFVLYHTTGVMGVL